MNAHFGSLLTVVILFLLGLISPGPNFIVVAQATLTWGRFAGFVTGLGAATGDALYAACGLFGVAQLIQKGGWVMTTLKLLGGCYLAWIGLQRLVRRAVEPQNEDCRCRPPMPSIQHFIRGLATDLANPKTVVFFASIFAVTVEAETPRTIRVAMLFAIVLTSIVWRLFLSLAFSTRAIRVAYQKSGQSVERVFGAAMCLLGLRLVKQAVS